MRKVTLCILVFIGLLLTIFIGARGYSLAKYVAKSSWNYYLESKGFYFNSDVLNGKDNVNNNWDGGSVNFTITNSNNDSLSTGFDINYKATCSVIGEASSSAGCLMNGTNSDTYEGVLSSNSMCVNTKDSLDVSSYDKDKCISDGYEWKSSSTSSNLYFDIVNLDNNDVTGLNVLVEVQSTSPYKKTLSSTFILNKSLDLIGTLDVKYTENDINNRLVITNSYDEDKCVKLSWDSSILRLDITKDMVKSYNTDKNGYVNEIVLKVNKKDSKDFLVYKSDVTKNINNKDFTLIETNGC